MSNMHSCHIEGRNQGFFPVPLSIYSLIPHLQPKLPWGSQSLFPPCSLKRNPSQKTPSLQHFVSDSLDALIPDSQMHNLFNYLLIPSTQIHNLFNLWPVTGKTELKAPTSRQAVIKVYI